MRVWITKWALSQGIIERNAEATSRDGMVRVASGPGYATYIHNEGTDWHRSYDSAVQRAEVMRQKKIASLKQQIKRLEKLSFVAAGEEST